MWLLSGLLNFNQPILRAGYSPLKNDKRRCSRRLSGSAAFLHGASERVSQPKIPLKQEMQYTRRLYIMQADANTCKSHIFSFVKAIVDTKTKTKIALEMENKLSAAVDRQLSSPRELYFETCDPFKF